MFAILAVSFLALLVLAGAAFYAMTLAAGRADLADATMRRQQHNTARHAHLAAVGVDFQPRPF